jgi:hypothetical protein
MIEETCKLEGIEDEHRGLRLLNLGERKWVLEVLAGFASSLSALVKLLQNCGQVRKGDLATLDPSVGQVLF